MRLGPYAFPVGLRPQPVPSLQHLPMRSLPAYVFRQTPSGSAEPHNMKAFDAQYDIQASIKTRLGDLDQYKIYWFRLKHNAPVGRKITLDPQPPITWGLADLDGVCRNTYGGKLVMGEGCKLGTGWGCKLSMGWERVWPEARHIVGRKRLWNP
ncbi:unnamed protein product [Cuscuta campestris]|uniref:Uncharacterized protein n=1 Tax=Cuscuta campestris TaxID=132261 RepID=A0A484MAL4_9ASTE|nr:unnamed protein product [Cuscuta campestris]